MIGRAGAEVGERGHPQRIPVDDGLNDRYLADFRGQSQRRQKNLENARCASYFSSMHGHIALTTYALR